MAGHVRSSVTALIVVVTLRCFQLVMGFAWTMVVAGSSSGIWKTVDYGPLRIDNSRQWLFCYGPGLALTATLSLRGDTNVMYNQILKETPYTLI